MFDAEAFQKKLNELESQINTEQKNALKFQATPIEIAKYITELSEAKDLCQQLYRALSITSPDPE